jgi:hypothetical protein
MAKSQYANFLLDCKYLLYVKLILLFLYDFIFKDEYMH